MPAVVRYPKAPCPREEEAYAQELVPGKGVFVRRSGAETLLVALGSLVSPAVIASDALHREAALLPAGGARGGGADVYSPRFLAPFDDDTFLEIASSYARVIVLEEGVARGGFGEYLVSLIATRLPRVSASATGFPSRPFAQGSRDELLARAGLGAAGIVARVLEAETSDLKKIFVFRAALEGD